MMERDYKFIIGILLTTNVICLIIITVLCGEIFSLQEKLSEMTDTVRTLNDKISRIEVTSRTDYICTKLDVILNSIITKDLNLNSIFSNLNSERSDWE